MSIGHKKRSSMNERAFLKTYNPKDFDAPLVTVDAVLFTFHEETLKVLLVERSNHPEKGKWGLPGGFIDLEKDKTIEDTVIRNLKDKTGVTPPYIEQLVTIGNNSRDKRGWSVTACYSALIAHQDCETNISTVTDAQWVKISKLSKVSLAFDHAEIIAAGRERLKQKALYSIVPAYALPKKFTIPELQHVHEALIGKPLQKKSFRRRIEQANLLLDTGEQRRESGRPATLYKIRNTSKEYRFIRNLGE